MKTRISLIGLVGLLLQTGCDYYTATAVSNAAYYASNIVDDIAYYGWRIAYWL